MAHTNNHKSNDMFGTISTLSLFVTIAAMSIVSMLRIIEHLRPCVGDIISFDSSKIVAENSEPRIEVRLADTSDAVPCVLDVGRMRQSNGSVMIEARRRGAILNYRVHWAGGPTSDVPTNCGASANLLLNETQITILKIAAGR